MYTYIEVTRSMFIDAFKKSSYSENFSLDGLSCLFSYLEDDEEMEFEVAELACSFCENTPAELLEAYPTLFEGIDMANSDAVSEILSHKTLLVGTVWDEEGVVTSYVYAEF